MALDTIGPGAPGQGAEIRRGQPSQLPFANQFQATRAAQGPGGRRHRHRPTKWNTK